MALSIAGAAVAGPAGAVVRGMTGKYVGDGGGPASQRERSNQIKRTYVVYHKSHYYYDNCEPEEQLSPYVREPFKAAIITAGASVGGMFAGPTGAAFGAAVGSLGGEAITRASSIYRHNMGKNTMRLTI